MISVYQLKPAFQRLLSPLLARLRAAGVTPNQLTLAALGFSALAGWLLSLHPAWPPALLLFPLCLLLRMALNALDGMMARTYQMQSRRGEILNELGDVLSDLLMYWPLAVQASPVWGYGFLMGLILNEFAGVLGKAAGGARRYDGPMGKSDRALLAGLFCIAAWAWPPAWQALEYVLGAAIGLMALSATLRLLRTFGA
ncbi:MAG: CDP-alcohol phosphatidyltransferase family protein [Bacteroidia bacterium]|nr:CDP-alcohol phosphatidyltransferase family protein [Bacteroidia bacterium]